MIRQSRLAVMMLGAAVFAGACKKEPPPPPTPVVTAPTGPTQAELDAQARAKAEQDRLAKLRADSIRLADEATRSAAAARAAAAAEAARLAALASSNSEAAKATLGQVVRFELDKYELRDDSKASLDAKLPILTANPAVTLRIAGHADDRGSGEYNLQLGQRRAAAVRDYMTARGVAATRIELISYGEERPLCKDQDESCWSQNRRAEFEITAGGTMLKKP